MGERTRRWMWYGAIAAAWLWALRVTMLPATVRGARVTGVDGSGPYYVELAWRYGLGARPQSVIVDLETGEAAGSFTTDGEALEGEIPVGVPPRGAYRLTLSATYRLLGFAHTVITRANGRI
jgi:hypothetical protein